jgi:hypothetical protein
MFGKVKEWLAELKISRAAEETLSQQVQLLQQKVVQLQQELSAEVAAAAASAAQINVLKEALEKSNQVASACILSRRVCV